MPPRTKFAESSMFRDQSDPESQPLSGYTDGSDDIGLRESSEGQRTFSRDSSPPPSSRSPRSLVVFAAALLCTGLVSAAVGAHLRDSFTNLDASCAMHTTHYSPVLSEVPIKYGTKTFNGTFMEEDVYRQGGSPEVDAAWEALGVDYRAGVISDEEGRKSGLTSAHLQRSEKYGGGFFVNVEGMHHLHCLNLVRKSLWYNYDHYKAMGHHAFANEEHIVRLHVSHCLDTIRQVLMCNVDTGVLGQVWYDQQQPKGFPDFNTKHTCKNYDAVRAWAEKHQAPLPETLPDDYMKPPETVLADIP